MHNDEAMINRVWKYLTSYSIMYWISVLTIVILSVGLFISNNYSSVPANQMIKDAENDSNGIKEILKNTEESFAAYDEMLIRTAELLYRNDVEWVGAFDKQSSIMFDGFSVLHPHISGYFINIDNEQSFPIMQKYFDFSTKTESHITVIIDSQFIYGTDGLNNMMKQRSEPVFVSIPSSLRGGFELAYVVPLYINDKYRGLMGIVLNKSALGALFGGNANNTRHMTLLTPNLEVISSTNDFPVGGRLESIDDYRYKSLADKLAASGNTGYFRERYNNWAWIDIFLEMPSGQIFWESFRMIDRMRVTNLLILMLSFLALFCNWFVQKRGELSRFDMVSNYIVGKAKGVSEETMIGNKASLAVHIALLLATAALLVFGMIGNASLVEQLSYLVFLILTLISMLWYRKASHPSWISYLYIFFFLISPTLVHHLSGGFFSQNAGQIVIFSVMSVIVSSFILKNKRNFGMFSLFVVVLFVSAIIESFTIETLNQDLVIRFVTVIFFLGFALFLSTDLYVNGVTNLLNRLKATQSELVKREKMVTLGRLVASVAHEINTPLSSIKASVEEMEESVNKSLLSVMDAGTLLDEHDRNLYFRLVGLYRESLNEIYSTMQIRRAKPALRELLTEMGCDSPDVAVETLARLEIINIEEIRKNAEIFESRNLRAILTLLVATSPIIKGTYIIKHSTAKTSKIVFALRSYSSLPQSEAHIRFNLLQNVENVIILLYNQMKSTMELVRDYDENLPDVCGNPDELGQLWINLIQNAAYAIQKGTNTPGVMKISIKKIGSDVRVSVEDNGCGISSEEINNVFEPFYTTKAFGEGSGLGLDICKKIALAHKGSINVESEISKGTVFHVTLPAIYADAPE